MALVKLKVNAYATPEPHPLATHFATRWVVRPMGALTWSPETYVFDSGWDEINLNQIRVELVAGSYEFRAMRADNFWQTSEWSAPIAFTVVPEWKIRFDQVFGLFVGMDGRIAMFDDSVSDDLVTYGAYIESDTIAPVGAGGECVFHRMYVVITSLIPGIVVVEPIVNGRPHPSFQLQLPSNDEPTQKMYPLDLRSGDSANTSQGVRGTWIAARIMYDEVLDPYLSFDGVSVDAEEVPESLPGALFSGDDVIEEAQPSPLRVHVGADGVLLEWDAGENDDAQPAVARAGSDSVAPAGVETQAVMHNLYLPCFRTNATPIDLTITPILDGIDQTAYTVSLPGTPAPLVEIIEIPLYRTNGSLTWGMIGVWFEIRIETADLPVGELHFGTPEIECESTGLSPVVSGVTFEGVV